MEHQKLEENGVGDYHWLWLEFLQQSFTIGSFFIVETPNSLVERGRLEKGKEVLRKIRGTNNYNIEPDLLELVEACRISKQLKQCPFQNLLKTRNRPQLIIAVALQTFQQLTGIDAVMFYVPVFPTIGYGFDASLYSALIAGSFNVISTIVSMYFVDRVGLRKLLLESGVHMFLSHVLISIILGTKVKDNYDNLTHSFAIFVVILAEIFPLETRSGGQSVAVCVNFLFTFAITNASLSMLCRFKFGILLFYSGWIIVMYFFVLFFLPETKNIPIEDMKERLLKRH